MGRTKFSRALKRSICIEYMQSGMSRKEISLKYDLPSVNTLSSWINSCLSPLEIHEKCASLPLETVQMDNEMATENISYTAEKTGNVYDFNTAEKLNQLLIKLLLATGQLTEGGEYDVDFDHQFLEAEKYDSKRTYKGFDGCRYE